METWKCDACVKSFTGLVCFQQHEASEKHKKKIRMINGGIFETPNSVNPDSTNQLHCSVCMVSFSGLDNYQKHVNSLDHAIMIQRKSEGLVDQSSISPVSVLKPYAECKPCQKQFSGPEPYQQHLASAGHFKKCGHSKTILKDVIDSKVGEAVDSKGGDVIDSKGGGVIDSKGGGVIDSKGGDVIDSKGGDVIDSIGGDVIDSKMGDNNLHNDPESSIPAFARCDFCQLLFTGPLSFQMHLVSDSHKKKAQLPTNSIDESLCPFKCSICNMTFTGPIPYEQHLMSNGHKKKTNASGLSTRLSTTGSLSPLDCTSKTSYTSLEQSFINDPRWYCDTCKRQCSGPIPYTSHLISRDHSKKLRILAAEENLKKIREPNTFPHVENNKTDSSLCNESTVHLNSVIKKEMQESSIENKIKDLSINIKGNDSKILSEKFQVNASDLIALPNVNIISLKKMDIPVFGPEDEIVFSNPKKCKQEAVSEMDGVKNVCTEKIFSNSLEVEKF